MRRTISRRLRALVRERAHRRCEYCLFHEDDVILPHEPDHIIAVKHHGPTSEENLAWTCFFCNRHKGTDLFSFDIETSRFVRLFNPRRDRRGRHFRLQRGRIVARTAVGRVTESLLQFNRPSVVAKRLQLISEGLYPG